MTRNPWDMFGGVLSAWLFGHKHDHYKDFGWPLELTFDQLHRMFTRNSLAAAAVNKTVGKTWQDNPEIWETEKPAESDAESEIRQRFEDLRVWQTMAEADRRSLVADYSGVILRLRDGRRLNEPVGPVSGGLAGLVEVIPAWSGQLIVSEWQTDQRADDYGKPTMYQFNETAVGTNPTGGRNRQFSVHPDRVIVWSADGTVHGRSALAVVYNDLVDAEKVKGGGAEGFWKASRGAPVITAKEGLKPSDVAKTMGVTTDEVLDKINQQIDLFNQGFDKGLLLGGMDAKPMDINLPTGDHFFNGPVSCLAAGFGIPVKILLGSQTGERASTEDAREWDQTNMSRRNNYCRPLIREFINRLERFGLLEKKDWFIGWADLTDSTAGEKMQRAKDMSEINAKLQPAGYDPPFTSDEIREAAGYDPATERETADVDVEDEE